MLIHQAFLKVVYCALCSTLTRFTKFAPMNFSKGGYPVALLPPPRRLVPSLGLGTTWVRQPRSGSCHYPTAATKCNEQPSQATTNPVGGKACSSIKVVYCALYSTLTRFTKFAPTNFSKGGYPVTSEMAKGTV